MFQIRVKESHHYNCQSVNLKSSLFDIKLRSLEICRVFRWFSTMFSESLKAIKLSQILQPHSLVSVCSGLLRSYKLCWSHCVKSYQVRFKKREIKECLTSNLQQTSLLNNRFIIIDRLLHPIINTTLLAS